MSLDLDIVYTYDNTNEPSYQTILDAHDFIVVVFVYTHLPDE